MNISKITEQMVSGGSQNTSLNIPANEISEIEYNSWLTLPITIDMLNRLDKIKKDLLNRAMGYWSNKDTAQVLLIKASTIDEIIKSIKSPDNSTK